jgi:xanthine dehydrogenase small subunit
MYPHAILIHGATDIALKVTKNHEWLDHIIDLSQVSELSQVQEGEEKTSFGAGLRLEEVKQLSKDLFPALHDCLEVFGSLQIRNLATLGGNIASASPIGDTLPVLMAYGATVTLANTHGQREIPVTDFITGYRETCLEDDEILVNISIPSAHKNHLVKWYKVSKRKDLDISSVSGGFFLSLDQNQVQNIKLYYGGLAAQTKLASNTGDFLINQPWTWETIRAATPLLEKDFIPISDARADAESRMIMAKNLLLKLWSETSAEN